jgi:hypothetical protein
MSTSSSLSSNSALVITTRHERRQIHNANRNAPINERRERTRPGWKHVEEYESKEYNKIEVAQSQAQFYRGPPRRCLLQRQWATSRQKRRPIANIGVLQRTAPPQWIFRAVKVRRDDDATAVVADLDMAIYHKRRSVAILSMFPLLLLLDPAAVAAARTAS